MHNVMEIKSWIMDKFLHIMQNGTMNTQYLGDTILDHPSWMIDTFIHNIQNRTMNTQSFGDKVLDDG